MQFIRPSQNLSTDQGKRPGLQQTAGRVPVKGPGEHEMGVPHKPHVVGRSKRKMLPEISEGQQQACLLVTIVLGEGPAKSPVAWGSWQKAQAGAFWRSRFGWGGRG